jgi:hypothetical protein
MQPCGRGMGGMRPPDVKQGGGAGYSMGYGEGTGCGLGNYRGDGSGEGYKIHQKGVNREEYRATRLLMDGKGIEFYLCQLHTLGGWS